MEALFQKENNMKIYPYLNSRGFSNCYLVLNENIQKAIIIDPGQFTSSIIKKLESNSYKLEAVLITHSHPNHTSGLKTLQKLYTLPIYAADWNIAGSKESTIKGCGKLNLAGIEIEYKQVPGHTTDSIVYKIENALFTGDTISAGKIGNTSSKYSEYILKNNIAEKIFSLPEDTIILPGHGPITSVASEKQFNIDMTDSILKNEPDSAAG